MFPRMSKLQPSPEVLRSIDTRCLSVGTGPAPVAWPRVQSMKFTSSVVLLPLLISGCLSAQTGMDETGVVLSTGSSSGDRDSSGDAGSSGDSGIMTTTEDPEHTTGASVSSGVGTASDTSGSESIGTTGIPAQCGDGVMQAEDGEACDDGAANADDAACTSHCQVAKCGDGLLQSGVEVCDDGVNDGSYKGCAVGCAAKAGDCGDGIVQGPEQCDGGEAKGGCLLETCTIAKSCKEIRAAFGDVADGLYTIAPKGAKLSVVCDMDADGGGYTFLKVARLDPADAKTAEMECAKYGMRLLVPRSAAHLAAAVQVAQSDVLAPIGVGPEISVDYLKIFGIYPEKAGQSCAGKPFNNKDCPQWTAVGGVFWVTSQAPVDISEPGIKTCTQCSLAYYWSANWTLDAFESVSEFNADSKSTLFMCEVPDKLP